MELKPGYKETEVRVIPEDWEVKRLGDIADIVMGQSPSSSNYNSRGDGLPLIQGNADIVDRRTIKRIFTMQITKKGREGDVLMSVRAPVGEISRALFDVCLGRGVCAIRFPNDFLYHFLIFLETSWAKHSKGSTFDSVNSADVKAVEVELPSDPKEQTAIATALSDADALLDGLDRLIAKKRDLKKAVMQQLLTGKTRLPGFEEKWEMKRLGDIADIVMGQSPSSSNYNSRGDGLPLIQGNADIVDRRTIKRIFTMQITKKGREGDVLMSVRAPVGEISRALFDVCLGRGVCAIRFPNDFLYHFLIFLETSWAKHSKGSTFDSVNSADVKAVEVELPSDPKEQTAIATALSNVDGEIAALEQRRKKTKNLKQAMMQELLTGKTRLVTPRGSNA